MQADLKCACWTAGCRHSWGIPVSDPSCPTPGVTRNALACYLWKSIDVPKRMGAINYLLDWFMTELWLRTQQLVCMPIMSGSILIPKCSNYF